MCMHRTSYLAHATSSPGRLQAYDHFVRRPIEGQRAPDGVHACPRQLCEAHAAAEVLTSQLQTRSSPLPAQHSPASSETTRHGPSNRAGNVRRLQSSTFPWNTPGAFSHAVLSFLFVLGALLAPSRCVAAVSDKTEMLLVLAVDSGAGVVICRSHLSEGQH